MSTGNSSCLINTNLYLTEAPRHSDEFKGYSCYLNSKGSEIFSFTTHIPQTFRPFSLNTWTPPLKPQSDAKSMFRTSIARILKELEFLLRFKMALVLLLTINYSRGHLHAKHG